MMDSWCSPVRAKSGNLVSGGAARNVRISGAGGMDQIIEQVAREASRRTLELADAMARQRPARPKLRLVA
jgi:hypothetical protein